MTGDQRGRTDAGADIVNVLGLFELTGAAEARRRRAETAELRELLAAALSTVSACVGSTGPPAVACELITMTDRLVDLATADAAEILGWFRTRVDALLALCEVAPITDGGTVDFLRHEVVADRPAPRDDLVDHIADTVRPGYRWRNDLIRPQQVVAYVDAGGP